MKAESQDFASWRTDANNLLPKEDRDVIERARGWAAPSTQNNVREPQPPALALRALTLSGCQLDFRDQAHGV